MFGMYSVQHMYLVALLIGASSHVDANGATQGWAVLLLQIVHVCVIAHIWPYNDRISNFMALGISILLLLLVLLAFMLPTPVIIGGQSPFGSASLLSRQVVEEIMVGTGMAIFIFIGIREATGVLEW